MKKYFALGILVIVAMISCKNKTHDSPKLKNGRWNGEFILKDHQIPFMFDVGRGNSDKTIVITLINSSEHIPISDITYKGDTVIIRIKDYDTQLKGVINGDTLNGTFKRLFSDNDPGIPFKAVFGDDRRLIQNKKSFYSLTGRWDIEFITANDIENNVGIFDQKDGTLSGSVLTNSGDLRYLGGVSDRDGFELSAFAGSTPYLIKGVLTDNDHFEGAFVTSRHVQKIKGVRNENATIKDPYSLTNLHSGYKTLGFKLPDLNGNIISLSDHKYKNKVVVVSIFGSWCPNCMDEMAFLSPWYKENKNRGVEIIGLAFERKDNPEYVHQMLTNIINKYDNTYDILFAGKIGDASNILPEIDQLKSYPTTIFIDKNGVVRKIHTGFNGPATGLFYEEFKNDFNNLIDQLLAE